MKTNTLFRGIILMGAMLLLNVIQAQTTINGSVVDEETNQPLPGVNVVIKGTFTGVSADFDGNFSITTDEQLPIMLEVSYLGYTTKTLEVTSSDSPINILLAEGSNALDEIVVAVRHSGIVKILVSVRRDEFLAGRRRVHRALATRPAVARRLAVGLNTDRVLPLDLDVTRSKPRAHCSFKRRRTRDLRVNGLEIVAGLPEQAQHTALVDRHSLRCRWIPAPVCVLAQPRLATVWATNDDVLEPTDGQPAFDALL